MYPWAYLTSHSLASILPPTTGNHSFVLHICKSASFVILTFVIFFRFHIYMISDSICLSVWLISLNIRPSKAIHVGANGKTLFFFNRWVIFHCLYMYIYTYTPLLYPIICQWTLRLLLYLGSCKQYCNEHWGVCMFFNCFFFFSDIYPEMEFLGHMIVLFLVFWEIAILFSTVASLV